MLFLCSGPHNTSLSNAVKKVAVLKYHPHDVVACDENGHVASHFHAMGSEPLNSVRITAPKIRKNRKPRAKFMISRNRTIIS